MKIFYLIIYLYLITIISNQELEQMKIKFLDDNYSLGNSAFNQQVINYIKSHAHTSSTGYCAKYVADAIESTGTKLVRQQSAYMYGQNLINIGYSQVGCTGCLPGDVIVIERSSTHVHGHIEIKGDDGFYYSDFKQKTYCPYSDGCTLRCYRHT